MFLCQPHPSALPDKDTMTFWNLKPQPATRMAWSLVDSLKKAMPISQANLGLGSIRCKKELGPWAGVSNPGATNRKGLRRARP